MKFKAQFNTELEIIFISSLRKTNYIPLCCGLGGVSHPFSPFLLPPVSLFITGRLIYFLEWCCQTVILKPTCITRRSWGGGMAVGWRGRFMRANSCFWHFLTWLLDSMSTCGVLICLLGASIVTLMTDHVAGPTATACFCSRCDSCFAAVLVFCKHLSGYGYKSIEHPSSSPINVLPWCVWAPSGLQLSFKIPKIYYFGNMHNALYEFISK